MYASSCLVTLSYCLVLPLTAIQQLIKDGGFDDERKKELQAAAEASRSVLSRANAAMDKEQRLAAVEELKNSVEDWKQHKIEHFGDLLLYGNFTVVKGDGAKDVEREVCSLLLPSTFGSSILHSRASLNPNEIIAPFTQTDMHISSHYDFRSRSCRTLGLQDSPTGICIPNRVAREHRVFEFLNAE